jgi:hypothetical protein
VLTASGDSVTSSHFQWGYGPPPPPCAQTSSDTRNLPGNDGVFSYVRRYFDLNGSIVDYENFARTGFNTGDMGWAGPGALDTCGSPWARALSPIGLSAARIGKAKQDGHKAYHVTTGGANNTNWVNVLIQMAMCRAAEFANEAFNTHGRFSFYWSTQSGSKEGVIPNGDGCVFRIDWLDPTVPDTFWNITVPRYNGPERLAGVTTDANIIGNWLLSAGADKVVWMLYYDITPANIDIANAAWTFLRAFLGPNIASYLPPQVGPVMEPLVDPMFVGTVRRMIDDINFAIWWGAPADPKLMVAFPPPFTSADIQFTAAGGSPHPSAAGQDKLAATLASVFNSIP